MWMILSDSHDNLKNIEKAIEIASDNHVDHIFHLGDFVSPFMIHHFLGDDHEFIGVFGNNDGDKLLLQKRAQGKILNSPNWANIDGKKIYLMHEPRSLYPAIKSQLYDLILFGHTHRLVIKKFGKSLIVNPGESCGCLSGKATCVLLDPQNFKTRVVEL
jgi:putative phosphoesterase